MTIKRANTQLSSSRKAVEFAIATTKMSDKATWEEAGKGIARGAGKWESSQEIERCKVADVDHKQPKESA